MKLHKPQGDRLSIKWELFGFLACFVAILLVLLWLFQIVFLESFYKSIKINSIKKMTESVARNINDADLSSQLKEISSQGDVFIRIVDEQGCSLYASEEGREFIIRRMTQEDLSSLFIQVRESGGTLLHSYTREDEELRLADLQEKLSQHIPLIQPEPPAQRDPYDPQREWERHYFPFSPMAMQTTLCGKIALKADGSEVLVLLTADITPVNTTVETLRAQLFYITVILLTLSLGLAFLISRKISKPIITITNTAKELATGNYDVTFHGKGYREITQLSNTLNYAAKELSKVESLRRELIANVSHDLRTPLTLITGYAEVMRDIPGENTPENVQIIIDEARHLSSLVSDMLDLSKLQSGGQEYHITRFNLTQSVRDIITRYSKLIQQDGYIIKFISGVDIFVEADEIRISQVVYNLINNAVTYTGADKLVTVCQTAANGTVKLEIIDTGDGIEAEMLPYIWDRYFKADKAHKRSSVGTGLGLSIVKAILDAHHAVYSVISTPGQGSIFWFELPVSADPNGSDTPRLPG